MKTLRTGETLAAVHGAAGLSDEAAAFLKPDREPRQYVQILIRNRLYADVVGLIAHVLPPRESVWWAWSCARDAAGEAPAAGVTAMLEATRQWIVEPTEERRYAAGDAAAALEYDSAAAMAGFAAFMCGDTMAPQDAPAETPAAPAPPGAVAKAITGAICMAAAEGDPEGIGARFEQFIARGMERADKGAVWAPDPGEAGGEESG